MTSITWRAATPGRGRRRVRHARSPSATLHSTSRTGRAPASFERFLARVSRCPRVVILAGDVHYAASFVMDYQRFDVPAADGASLRRPAARRRATSRIVNFTSSPIRNEWPHEVPALVRTIGSFENLEQVGFEALARVDTHHTAGLHAATTTRRTSRGCCRAAPARARHAARPGWKNAHKIPAAGVGIPSRADLRHAHRRRPLRRPRRPGPTQVLAANTPDAPPDPDGES